jgi:hypothetical protein
MYYIGKSEIKRASEQELISIFSSSLITIYYQRKRSKSESWALLIGLIFIFTFPYFIQQAFFILQRMVVFSSNATYISEAQFYIPAVFVSGSFLYYGWLLVAKRVQTKDGSEYWRRQPSLKDIRRRKKKIKRNLLILSIIGQFFFTLNMLAYTQIDETGVKCSPIYTIQTYQYDFKNINEAKMYVSEQNQYSRGRNYKVYKPHLKIYFPERQRIDLWKSIHWGEKDYERLKKALVFLQENRVPLHIDTPSILEKSTYQKYFRRDIYDEIMAMFTYAESVREDRYIPISIGETLEMDDIDIRIDSSVADYGEGFMSPTKGNRFEMVHLTIKNNEPDTFILVQMHMHLYDANNKVYNKNLWAKDTFNSYIPPYETHSGSIAFMVPDTVKQLRLKYQLGFMNKRFLWFDLSKNVPKDRENQ